jgi:hypothetical protein
MPPYKKLKAAMYKRILYLSSKEIYRTYKKIPKAMAIPMDHLTNAGCAVFE